MRGRDNISGANFLYSLGVIVAGFITMFLVIDFFQITNAKETLDQELKRSISYNMILYLNDKYSTDRSAFLTDDDKLLLQNSLKNDVENELAQKYSSSFKIDYFDIVIDDNKVYIKYKAVFHMKPILLKSTTNISLPITIIGRSKAQRFDVI